MGMCETTLIGVLIEEPKVYDTESGYKITTLRMRVDLQKIIKGEPRVIQTWHTVKVFGNKAEAASKFKKDEQLLIRGELRRNKWINKEGEEKISWEIVAEYIDNLFGQFDEPSTETAETSFAPKPKEDSNEYVPF